jgi:hypothetical protein
MDNEAHRAYLVREARTTYTAGRERPAPGSLPGAKGGFAPGSRGDAGEYL